jgi:rhodanese-related sulfurtransferase
MKNSNSNLSIIFALIIIFAVAVFFTACKGIDSSTQIKDSGKESNEIVENGKSQIKDEIIEDSGGDLMEEEQEQEAQTETNTDDSGTVTDTVEIKSISAEEVYDIIQNKEDYYILDVRTEQEYNEGYIEGASLIPVQVLESKLDLLPQDKPIIVYCRSGNRSRTAAEILVKNGFTMVYDMGGINSWIDKGFLIITIEE